MSVNPKNKTNRAVLVRDGRADHEILSTETRPVLQTQDAGDILEETDTGNRWRWTGTEWIQVGNRGATCVDPGLHLTSFNELSIAEPTPITQITAPYGFLQKAQKFLVNGGTAGASSGLFFATSGTNTDALAACLTRRQVQYRAGQGTLARLTALFDTPQADSAQEAGLIINTDRFAFGYENTTFGIIYKHGGESEVQELTITGASAGSEDATVTVSGTGFTIPITVGTVQHNAFEIAVSLNSQVSDYDFSSNNDQVVARSLVATPGGSFAFSSGTATGSWSQVIAGVVPTSDFIAQVDWNFDIFSDLDPTKGNVYQIQVQYLGFGGIEFYVESKETAKFMLVHRIEFANTATVPIVGNPTFRVGWLASNGPTNTTSITVQGASAAGFVEGIAVRTEASRAEEATNASVGNTDALNILTIRNRLVFGTRRNRAETFGLSLTAATDSNKAAVIRVHIGATIAGDLDFQYVDKTNSTTEVAKDAGIVTGGRLVASFVIPPAGGQPFNLEQLASLILPGEVMTISAVITAGAASGVTASLTWQEDL